MNKEQMLEKLRTGKANTSMQFFIKMMKKYGFILKRIKGSHQVYIHPDISDYVVIQPQKKNRNQAKPYQIDQFLDIVKKFNL